MWAAGGSLEGARNRPWWVENNWKDQVLAEWDQEHVTGVHSALELKVWWVKLPANVEEGGGSREDGEDAGAQMGEYPSLGLWRNWDAINLKDREAG